jgi:hypothetical protein
MAAPSAPLQVLARLVARAAVRELMGDRVGAPIDAANKPILQPGRRPLGRRWRSVPSQSGEDAGAFFGAKSAPGSRESGQ